MDEIEARYAYFEQRLAQVERDNLKMHKDVQETQSMMMLNNQLQRQYPAPQQPQYEELVMMEEPVSIR